MMCSKSLQVTDVICQGDRVRVVVFGDVLVTFFEKGSYTGVCPFL